MSGGKKQLWRASDPSMAQVGVRRVDQAEIADGNRLGY